MGTPLRFGFDTEFAADGSIKPTKEELAAMKEPELPPEPTFSEQEVAMARQQGYEQGRQEALNESQASIEQQIAAAMHAIAQHMQQVAILQHQANQQVRKEAAMLAGEVGRALATRLLADEPLSEMEDVINACMTELGDEPRILVRVAEPVVEALKGRMTDMAARTGFQGQVLVLGEPSLPVGSCQLEWSSGGAERDQAAIEAAIQEALDRFIFSRQVPGDGPEDVTPEMAADFQRHQEEQAALAREEAERLAQEMAAHEAAQQEGAPDPDAPFAMPQSPAAEQMPAEGQGAEPSDDQAEAIASPEQAAAETQPLPEQPVDAASPPEMPEMSPVVDGADLEAEQPMGLDPMAMQQGVGVPSEGEPEFEDGVLDPMSMQQPMDAMAQDAMMAPETKENE